MPVAKEAGASTLQVPRALVGRDPLEERHPPRDERAGTVFEASRGAAAEEQRQRLRLEARVHLGEEALHVGEAPEHRAESDTGPLGHLLRRRLEDVLAHELEEGVDDSLIAAL